MSQNGEGANSMWVWVKVSSSHSTQKGQKISEMFFLANLLA